MSILVEHIGSATLYCADAREIVPTLGPIDTLLTDPPYGMAWRSNWRKEKRAAIANDADDELLLWACGLRPRHSAYIFARWDNLANVPKPRSLVTWVKDNWSMGDLNHEHGRQTEVAFFYPGPDHDFPDGRPADVIMAPRTENKMHQTEKPVALMRRFVGWTRGTVIDPFMGSGSTGVACVQVGRPFIGIELDRSNFDIACERVRAAASQANIFIGMPKRDVPPAQQEALF